MWGNLKELHENRWLSQSLTLIKIRHCPPFLHNSLRSPAGTKSNDYVNWGASLISYQEQGAKTKMPKMVIAKAVLDGTSFQ